MLSDAAHDIVATVLKDAAKTIVDVKGLNLPKTNLLGGSIDIEYNEDYFIEVSYKLIKRIK